MRRCGWRGKRLVIGTVIAALVGSATPTGMPTPTTASATFVTRSGSELRLDGHSYRFSGANIYSANSDGWCGPDYSAAQLAEAFEQIGQGDPVVVRSWFFQPLAQSKEPGTTKDWSGARDWTRFDQMLQVARDHNVRVVATLTDQWGECGDGGASGFKTADWYEGGYYAPQPSLQTRYDNVVSYRDWVQEIVIRYRDDPTILMWQLVNEAEVNPAWPAGCPGGPENGDVLTAFADDVSTLIRSIDADHLISLGTIGSGQCGTESSLYQQIHDLPNIDVCEVHDYDQTSDMPGDQWNGMMVRIGQCRALDKPLFVGEVGINPSVVGGTYEDRAARLRSKILRQQAEGIVGHLAWAYMRTGSTINNFDIGPGDPVLNVIEEAPAFVVNTTDDSDDGACGWAHCSFREAIVAANGNPGLDTIAFSISGPLPHSIAPTSELPEITDPVVIDGTTEPDFLSTPVVEITGVETPIGADGIAADGLRITAGGSTVRGLVLNGWTWAAIHLLGSAGTTIVGNRLGTNVDGTAARVHPSGVVNWGIWVENSSDNTIGGAAAGEANLVSGEGDGIAIEFGATGNVVVGNRIGTDVSGSYAIPNTFAGIRTSGGSNNQIGGSAPGEGNLVSGNVIGIDIVAGGSGPLSSSGSNVVLGNVVGLAADGSTALANTSHGIRLQNAPNNRIGGAASGEGNVISGNLGPGIEIFGSGTEGSIVEGNRVGTDVSGTSAVPNVTGILAYSASGAFIGSGIPGAGNLIAGNATHGIELGRGSQGVEILGNLIGTDASGLVDLGNGAFGIHVTTETGGFANLENRIGAADAGNVIAGNDEAGVGFTDTSSPATILRNNVIGLGADRSTPVPNGYGVLFGAGTTLGFVGEGDAESANVIAGNALDGVAVVDDATGGLVVINEIRDNGGLGIDLGDDGPTENDVDDLDDGPNHLQNAPVLRGAVVDADSATVTGTLDSVPDLPYVIYVYANPSCDTSGFGEAQEFLGLVELATDSSGTAAFSLYVPFVPAGRAITANAIAVYAASPDPSDIVADASEFSECVPATDSENTGQADVPPGDSVSTDSEGDGATSADPIETSVTTSPDGPTGTVSITETTDAAGGPTGFTFLSYQASIEAPVASVESPLVIEFVLFTGALPEGVAPADVIVFRDAVPVGVCAADSAGKAIPEPCEAGRVVIGDDLRITIRAAHASDWNFGTADDVEAPTITLYSPTDGAMYVLNSPVIASFACEDEAGGSGLDSCVGTADDGEAIDTSTVGSHEFTVTATDEAHNTRHTSVSYRVIYDFEGWFQPVDNGIVNRAKAGSTIPIKFSLSGDQGLQILAEGSPSVVPVSCTPGAPVDQIESTVANAGATLSYDAGTDTYTLLFRSSKGWHNSCRRLVVTLIDGETYTADFQFTK